MRAAPAASALIRVEGDRHGGVRVVLTGRLDVDATGAIWEPALRAARTMPRGVTLQVDASGLEYCDGTGAALLLAIEREARAAGGSFELAGLRPESAELVELLRPKSETPRSPHAALRPRPLASLGRATLGLLADLRDHVAFVGALSVFTLRALRRPRELRFRDAVVIADRAGIGAVPIVALVGFLLGLILSFQGAIPMQRFGAQIFVADLLAISMVRELGALMAAILLTARSASAFAAEIGTMKVNEEVDALTTMGLEPIRFLVLPRVLAAVAVVPALTVLINVAALLGGLVVFTQLGFPAVTFWIRVLDAVTVTDFVSGLGKAMVFGVIVASVGCLRGLQTGSGAQAVGRSTTSAVVSGIILIAVTDGIFAVVFYVLGI